MTMGPGLSARSNSPTGSEDSRQINKNRPVAISERQSEVREMVSLILTNIFKDVLNSRDSKEQVMIICHLTLLPFFFLILILLTHRLLR